MDTVRILFFPLAEIYDKKQFRIVEKVQVWELSQNDFNSQVCNFVSE